jgi:hypothetical protein
MEQKNVLLLREQFSPGNIQEKYSDNITAIMYYENVVLSVTKNLSELLFAYPYESDPGIYVIAMNGKVAAANNKPAICRYLESLEAEGEGQILIHKLGTRFDVNLHQKLREYALV